ncbi:MAG: Gfo/Idh/MocA family oxidoreductase [Candidatus Omnitrophota bacterium]
MAKEIRIGLIGYKFMGKAHSNAFHQVGHFFSPKAKPVLKAVCGRHPEELKEMSKKWGYESCETDWRRLVNRSDIDLVDITTSNDSHAEIAIAAANAGKAVFCEKPLALNLSQAEAMVKAVEKNRVFHAVCFNYRRVPALSLMKKMLSEGKLGKVYHFRGTYLQDWILDPKFPLVWRLQKEVAGTGALGDLASHQIDLARWLVGEIKEVVSLWSTFINERPVPTAEGGLSARGGKKTGKVTVDDATLFLARFANGAAGSFEATRFAAGRKNYNRLEINGEKGTLVFNMERMNELEYYDAKEPAETLGFKTIQVTEPVHPYLSAWWPPGHIIGYEHTFTHTVFDLINAWAEGKKSSQPDFYDGLACQKVLAAVEESAREGKWVKIKF